LSAPSNRAPEPVRERRVHGREKVAVRVDGRADVLVVKALLDDMEVRRDGWAKRHIELIYEDAQPIPEPAAEPELRGSNPVGRASRNAC
jgi:hypothetical protein